MARAGLPLGSALATMFLLLPVAERYGGAGRAATAAAVLVATAVGFVAHPALLGRFTDDPQHRARFAALAGAYGGLALACAGLVGARAAAAIPHVLGAALVGLCLRGVLDVVAGAAQTTSARAAALLAVPVAAGVAVTRWVVPLVPSISDFAADRVWRYAGLTQDNITALSVAGGAVTLVGAAGIVGLAAALAPLAGRDPASTGARTPCRGDALLEVRDLDVWYGNVQILFGVSLRVDPGEAVALLGTNGAGKSTVLRAVTGLTPVRRGEVWFNGERTTNRRAEATASGGLSMVPGGKGVFNSLTVEENLKMAGYRLGGAAYDAARDRVYDAFPQLAQAQRRPAALLSGGEQQMLALSRAHLTAPRLLAIDELTLGLAPIVVKQLIDFVRSLRDAGVALVVVEQSVNLALELCDRAYFLERGEVRFEGRTAELLTRHDLLRSVFLEGARSSHAGNGTARVRVATVAGD